MLVLKAVAYWLVLQVAGCRLLSGCEISQPARRKPMPAPTLRLRAAVDTTPVSSFALPESLVSADGPDLVGAWAAEKRRRGVEGWKHDETAMRAMLADLGWTRPAQMNKAEFRAYLGARAERGSARPAGEGGPRPTKLCARTQNKYQTRMSTFVQFLLDADILTGANWVREIPRARDRVVGKGKPPMTPEQFNLLLTKTRERGYEQRAAAYLSLWRSGMRPSDYQRAEVGGLVETATGATLTLSNTKNGKSRVIPLEPSAAAWARECAAGKRPGDRLFPRLPMPKQFHADMAAAGLVPEQFGYSSLRKGFAGERAMAGAPLSAVQKVMGHSSSRVTEEVYMQFSAQQLAEGLGFMTSAPRSAEKILDRGRGSDDTPGARSTMAPSPQAHHDDTGWASAALVDLANPPGVEARPASPCMPPTTSPKPPTGFEPATVALQSRRSGIQGSVQGFGERSGFREPTTRQIELLALTDAEHYRAAVAADAPRPVLSLLASRVALAWGALQTRLGGRGAARDCVPT